ncbi:type I-E CRISPR-associated protein Cse1/CasA [soil metagenome]
MNLVTEPWIPVVGIDGGHRLASVKQIFTEGRQFADLSVRPHERIALMRLLICIAQAALDGPEEYYDGWINAPKNLPDAAQKYLEQWRDSFELFHPKRPLLQIPDLEKPPKANKSNEDDADDFTSLSKLDFALATGNNTTLFDHPGMADVNRQFSPAAVALMLFTFQNFSPGGTIGVALWKQQPTPGWKSYPKVKPGQSNHAPCLPSSMLHSFIRHNTLFDTLCANLLTKERVIEHFGNDSWGRPIWQKPPSDFNDADNIKNATRTYLGRLIPLSRSVRLISDDKGMLLANGLEYPAFPNFPPETSATVIISKDRTKRLLLRAGAKAIWRELSALTVARKRDSAGGALTLNNLSENEPFDLWAGAFLTDKASVLDTVESVFHIPAKLRTNVGRAAYTAEVEWAEGINRKLSWAVETYREQIDGGWDARVKMAGPKKNELRGKLHATATRHYWTAVEKLRPLLMAHVETIGTTAEAVEKTRNEWRRAVHGAAREAYCLACGQETPRQMRAFALGWSKLFAKRKTESEKPEEPETEVTEGE